MIQLLNEAHTMAATVSIMKKHVVSTGEEEGSGRKGVGRGERKEKERQINVEKGIKDRGRERKRGVGRKEE